MPDPVKDGKAINPNHPLNKLGEDAAKLIRPVRFKQSYKKTMRVYSEAHGRVIVVRTSDFDPETMTPEDSAAPSANTPADPGTGDESKKADDGAGDQTGGNDDNPKDELDEMGVKDLRELAETLGIDLPKVGTSKVKYREAIRAKRAEIDADKKERPTL